MGRFWLRQRLDQEMDTVLADFSIEETPQRSHDVKIFVDFLVSRTMLLRGWNLGITPQQHAQKCSMLGMHQIQRIPGGGV